MTLDSETTLIAYAGDGSTTSFPITFVFWDTSDILAVLRAADGTETTWVYGTEFTLTGGEGEDGTLEVNTTPTDYTPASGETLTIKSDRSNLQSVDFPFGGPFPSASAEQGLDQTVRLVQQLAELIGRQLTAPVTDTGTSYELPNETNRASKYLAFDASGDPIASSGPTGDSSIPVSSFIETLLDDTTAAAARSTLGAGTMDDVVDDTTPQLGGPLDTNDQAINYAEGSSVAAASSTDIWVTDGNTLHITGNTGISDFDNAPRVGASRWLIFDGTPTVTSGSGITIAGGTFTAAAGDMAYVYADAVDAFRLVYFPVTKTRPMWVPIAQRGGSTTGYNSETGNVPHAVDGTAGDHGYAFKIPADFVALISATAYFLPDATETVTVDLLSDYGAVGEAYNTNDESSANETIGSTSGQFASLDVSGVLSALAAGDIVGLTIESDTDNAQGVGLEIVYSYQD